MVGRIERIEMSCHPLLRHVVDKQTIIPSAYPQPIAVQQQRLHVVRKLLASPQHVLHSSQPPRLHIKTAQAAILKSHIQIPFPVRNHLAHHTAHDMSLRITRNEPAEHIIVRREIMKPAEKASGPDTVLAVEIKHVYGIVGQGIRHVILLLQMSGKACTEGIDEDASLCAQPALLRRAHQCRMNEQRLALVISGKQGLHLSRLRREQACAQLVCGDQQVSTLTFHNFIKHGSSLTLLIGQDAIGNEIFLLGTIQIDTPVYAKRPHIARLGDHNPCGQKEA